MDGGVEINLQEGWKAYHLQIIFENGGIISIPHGSSIYMQGFLSDLYLRPHCYRCENKEGNHFSDLTLADYWGVESGEPDMDDNWGTSAVLIHTEKGAEILGKLP